MAHDMTYDEKQTSISTTNASSYMDASSTFNTYFYIASGNTNKAYGFLKTAGNQSDTDAYSMGTLTSGAYYIYSKNSNWYSGSGYSNSYIPKIEIYKANGTLVKTSTSGNLTFSVNSGDTSEYFIKVSGSSSYSSQYELSYSKTTPVNSPATSVNLGISGELTPGSTVSLTGSFSDANGSSSNSYAVVWYTTTDNLTWQEVGTGSTYTITNNDAGKWLEPMVTFVDDLGFSEQLGPEHVLIPALADTTPPTISIGASATFFLAGQPVTLRFVLSESSTNFDASDVRVTGGVLTNFSGSGTQYTATFNPWVNKVANGVVSVNSGAFTDAAGNANTDGSDADNTITLYTDHVETHTLSLVLRPDVLGPNAVLLKNLVEEVSYVNGRIEEHKIVYQGQKFDYDFVDLLSTFVTRDAEFTQEFQTKMTEAAPSAAELTYQDAEALFGRTIMNQLFMNVLTAPKAAEPLSTPLSNDHLITVIVDKGALSTDAMLLRDLKEVNEDVGGGLLIPVIYYSGVGVYYFAVDNIIMTVTRDGDFTEEFQSEIADIAPSASHLTYADAVTLLGSRDIDYILLNIAAADGDYIN